MKNAYVQYKSLLDAVPWLKSGNTTFGPQPSSFILWEEDLYQFLYVNLVPWNYVRLSSSQSTCIRRSDQAHGQRTDLPTSASVSMTTAAPRRPNKAISKQVMLKGTIYPLGSAFKYQELGLTGFYNSGYGNVAFEVGSPSPNKASTHSGRIAAVLHYANEEWNVAGEFEYGQNAFTANNLLSASGSIDNFGTASGTAKTSGTYAGNTCGAGTGTSTAQCYTYPNSFGPQVALYQPFLNNGRAREIGWDGFGHYHIPGTKLTAFGMFQWFLPNDHVQKDPLDSQSGTVFRMVPVLGSFRPLNVELPT